MTCTITPPADQGMAWTVDYFGNVPPDADPQAIQLMAHFALGRRASNIYVMEDGSVTTAQPPNWNPVDPTGPYAWVWNYNGSTHGVPESQSFTHTASLQVRNVYYGGHTSPVDPADEAALVAAGYGPYMDCGGTPTGALYPSSGAYPGPAVYPSAP